MFFFFQQIEMEQNHKEKIIKCAIFTRIFIILLQLVNNHLIPDYDAGVFLYPKTNFTETIYDKAVKVALGGLIRWDAQYFFHITKYGYSYENTLAFFPFYPLTIRFISQMVIPFVPFLNIDSVIILTYVIFNSVVFVKASLTLYELSALVLNESLAFKSALLYCFNPASIFFVAPYTETLFSFLTFKLMLYCWLIYKSYMTKGKSEFKQYTLCISYISLSTCTRSNGLLNVGFIVYFFLKYHIPKALKFRNTMYKLEYSLKNVNIISFCILVSVTPFILVQMHNYSLFCNDFKYYLPEFIVRYAKENDFVLPGMHSKYKQSWCDNLVPLAYSYVQEHYWNVGFLKYYQLKQLPNFLLALPIIYIVLKNGYDFFTEHMNYCLNLGIFRHKFAISERYAKERPKYVADMFVFVVHCVGLTLFCISFVHIQVTTRMLCSASPVVYWFSAYYFYSHDNSKALVNTFLFTNTLSREQKLLKYYFLGYLIIGTVLFCNFLPWT